MASDKAEVIKVTGVAPKTGYQSDEAKDAMMSRSAPSKSEEPKSAIIASTTPTGQMVMVDQAAEDKLVKVRPRETITRTKIGPNWYAFQAGKECLVPRHVERLLAEKGII